MAVVVPTKFTRREVEESIQVSLLEGLHWFPQHLLVFVVSDPHQGCTMPRPGVCSAQLHAVFAALLCPHTQLESTDTKKLIILCSLNDT